ncbi:shikimate dehydrogenase [Nereida sp. MMG025]|uniref:shikimate dehydrogenase n=1 Tax=Nereida sp. MMG025 TaxID=2909981 RepID=UPI001EFFF878|nr:shikimate dehydrogenase [Nereida sp. MMG025]MCF6444626.1 shikimate dehydrogenase [Nereida sp. MMG025]
MSDGPILAGVLGHPIGHSLSPRLHGHWLERYGINGHYVPLRVLPRNLAQTLKLLPKLGFAGVNVTIPHKEAVFKHADTVTERAKLIGAANTLVFQKGGKILADNTDGYGFMANLKSGAPDWSAKNGKAVVLGAGGASRAVIVSLLAEGAPEILLTNRTFERAEALAEEFGPRVTPIDWIDAGAIVDDANVLVNTTSLGMAGQSDLRVPLDGLSPDTLVTDIVYNPLETGLLRAAKAKGCVTVDGLGMLLHQAVPGFAAWFGQKPEVDDALRKAVLA